MKIERTQLEDALKLGIIGDLDASSAIDLDEEMRTALDKGQVKLMIDCQQLDYISAAGLGVFVSYLQDFKEKSGAFVFYGMKDSVMNVFQILGLDQLTSIVPSEAEAKELLNEGDSQM